MVDHEAYSLWGVTPCSLIYCIGTDIFERCVLAMLLILTDVFNVKFTKQTYSVNAL